VGRIRDNMLMIRQRLRAYPMVILLLLFVAAILLFIPRPSRYSPQKAPNDWQEQLYRRLESAGVTGDELATTGALTLGYKEDLSRDLRRHFQASGAAHVLAVSGLHTGIIYGLLLALMTLSGRYRPLYENRWGRRAISLVVITVMWGYAYLTGMTPSVVRAVLMVTIFETGRMLYRRAFSLNTIASAAVLTLIVRPTDLWNVSFQLSFTATASIVLVAKQMEGLLHRKEWTGTWKGRMYSRFIGIVIVSLAAQLGTIPISMYYFHQVSTYFLLTNLVVLPLAGVLVPLGLMTIALGASECGMICGKITEAAAWLMNHSVEWIEKLPGSTVEAHVNGWMIAVYYVLFILFYVLVLRKNTIK